MIGPMFLIQYTDLDWRKKPEGEFPRKMRVSALDRFDNDEVVDCEEFIADSYKDFILQTDKFFNEIQDIE